MLSENRPVIWMWCIYVYLCIYCMYICIYMNISVYMWCNSDDVSEHMYTNSLWVCSWGFWQFGCDTTATVDKFPVFLTEATVALIPEQLDSSGDRRFCSNRFCSPQSLLMSHSRIISACSFTLTAATATSTSGKYIYILIQTLFRWTLHLH